MSRTKNCLAKLDRMKKTLNHTEADRVPVSDFFWVSFLERWRRELGLPADADIYTYYDLDWICVSPNMDPHIKPFEMLLDTEEEALVRTGFEAVIRHRKGRQMPYFEHFDTDTIEKALAFTFDDPWDERRYFKGGDDQINGVGEIISRNFPPWIETVKALYPNFPVFGGICEAQEEGWRIIGSENMLLWLALYPDELEIFLKRVTDFVVEVTKAQIRASDGMLDGMVVWGDVAYRNGMFMSPETWRRFFKPCVKAIIDTCHAAGLPVIYHGCGNAEKIYPDFIELGLDAYNPLEAKAGLDVVELRKKYGHKMGFCGNMDALAWANDPLPELERAVLRKLNAAKGGGYIFQSDHSVPSNVSAERYEFVINVVRKNGNYPLSLGEFDIPDMT